MTLFQKFRDGPNKRDSATDWTFLAAAVIALVWIGFICGSIYVAWHFIAKYW